MTDDSGQARKNLTGPALVIGEGVEEVLIFRALLKHLDVGEIEVEAYGGKDQLVSYLKTLNVRPGFSSLRKIGITRDADDDAKAAEVSLKDSTRRAGLRDDLAISFFVLPGNGAPGALESLCLDTIAGDPDDACIKEYFACLHKSTGRQPGSAASEAKARAQTWLAGRKVPGLRLGHAVEKGYLNFNSPSFDGLKGFLRQLAVPVSG